MTMSLPQLKQLKPGDLINALYLSTKDGTCLALAREVLDVSKRADGTYTVVVDLPHDAAGETPGRYRVDARTCGDYFTEPTPEQIELCRALAATAGPADATSAAVVISDVVSDGSAARSSKAMGD